VVGSDPREVSADEPLPPDLQAGDIVQRGGFGVVVPPPGTGVAMVVDNDDGTAIELVVENPVDGAVRLVMAPEPILGTVQVEQLATTNECNDGAYKLEGPHWASTLSWSFNASTTPSANSQTNVEIALQNGANAITSSRNSCGLVDTVTATNQYLGRTTAKPNMTATSTTVTCGNTDGKNVVAFGYLPHSTLGQTCLWFDGSNVTFEADMRLNNQRAWFALGVPAGCTSRDGVEQVSTHEFGHAFGLAHVSQTTHPELTMSPIAKMCSNDKYSLGLGDILGLRALYP
jgi:hypothetical protein